MTSNGTSNSRAFDDPRKWHIDKTLNMGHLFATIALAGSLFAYASHMDRRVTMLEERLAATVQMQADNRNSVRELATDLKLEIRALRSDINRLMMSNSRPGVPNE